MILSSEIPKSIHSKKKVKVKCDDCGTEFERRFDQIIKSFEKHKNHKCRSCSTRNAQVGKKIPRHVVEKIIKTRTENNKKKYPKFTITCKCCNEEFTVRYGERNRIYCGRSCQAKSVTKTDIRKTSTCLMCKKDFKHYGERIVCSRNCLADYLSIIRIGENNPSSKRKKDKSICLYCKKEFEYTRSGLHTGRTRVFCSLACSHEIDLRTIPLSGRKDKYPREWDKVKKAIRSRDHYKCQLCGQKENNKKHHVHHIDYDKNNLDEQNLVTLCQKCHNMTHNGRTFWEIIFSGLMSGSKVVKKPWGAEIHITNNNNYCMKYLIFFKNRQFSYHTHYLKKELWHCVYGKLECVLSNGEKKEYSIFKQGDKIEIEPKIIHQLQAIRNSILIEVSTRDYPEDSIRLKNSIN